MNYRLISAILKSVWAIEPLIALEYGALVASIINGEEFELSGVEELKPYARDLNGNESNSFESAEKGSAAIIPLKGVLMKEDQFCGPVGMQTIGEWIKEAYASSNISAIVLDADTPGGSADGVESLYEIIENKNKPVVTYFDGMLASGGVWVASPSDEIIAATRLSRIGSVGVMLSYTDIQPFYERLGIKFHRVVADTSEEKTKIFEQVLKGNYDLLKKESLNPMDIEFMAHVEKHLPNSTEEQRSGKVFFAKDVIGELVDSIGNLNHAIERALSLVEPEVKTIKI